MGKGKLDTTTIPHRFTFADPHDPMIAKLCNHMRYGYFDITDVTTYQETIQ